jgi:cobalamin biosynthesis protein CobT
MVMCDGQPCGSFEGNGQWYLRQVCETIERSGDIELIGVGIMIDLVKNFYKNHVIVNDLQRDLEPKIIEALKKTLI